MFVPSIHSCAGACRAQLSLNLAAISACSAAIVNLLLLNFFWWGEYDRQWHPIFSSGNSWWRLKIVYILNRSPVYTALLGLCYRPTSQSGRPLSGFARPGTQSGRPGTMEQAIQTPRTSHTARPVTSASGRSVDVLSVSLCLCVDVTCA